MEINLSNKKTQECYIALEYLSQAISTKEFTKVINAKRQLKTKANEANEYFAEVGKKLNAIDNNGNVVITNADDLAKFNELTSEFSATKNIFDITPIQLSSLEGEKLNPANIELLMDAGIIV